MNSNVLAYLGDAVYELKIREKLINMNLAKVNDIQKKSLEFVSAKSQCKHIKHLIEINFLKEDEISEFKRGRNSSTGKSKSSDIVTYRIATGFETLIGYLYINKKIDRIDEIINKIIEG